MKHISILPKWPDVRPEKYYVYLHRKATDGSVFYVGKGTGKRGWVRTRKHNIVWTRTAIKHGVIIDIVKDDMDDGEAFDLERETILKLGIENLTNISTGGDGNGGVKSTLRKPVECSNGMSFASISDAASWLRSGQHKLADQGAISLCCKGKIGSAYGYNWRFLGSEKDISPTNHGDAIRQAKMKPVVRSDGVEFESAKVAAEKMGSPKSHGNIGACCNGKRRVALGYSWSFKQKGPL